jgi:hypothetical protein
MKRCRPLILGVSGGELWFTLLKQPHRQPVTPRGGSSSRRSARWEGIYPHLQVIGIKVSIHREFPRIFDAFHARLRQMQEIRSPGRVEPTKDQSQVAEIFPAIAKFVQSYGHVEIGDVDGFGFLVRAMDNDGQVFEDDRPRTLAEAMAALEKELKMWFTEPGQEGKE